MIPPLAPPFGLLNLTFIDKFATLLITTCFAAPSVYLRFEFPVKSCVFHSEICTSFFSLFGEKSGFRTTFHWKVNFPLESKLFSCEKLGPAFRCGISPRSLVYTMVYPRSQLEQSGPLLCLRHCSSNSEPGRRRERVKGSTERRGWCLRANALCS